MAVVVEMQNTGDLAIRSEIIASIEHALCQQPGNWRISIVGSRGSDEWEMRIEGPRGFERVYALAGSAGEHQPDAIRSIVLRLLSANPKTP
jgi:hypothetical protein